MAFLNYAKKEISAKIVYYGPGLSGKTTNLEWIHRKMMPERRGKLISLETRTDRTLFFDFLPVQLGEIKGFLTRFNVYTVPGQIFYNETRKMVLKGVDGIVFVADSQKEMANENLESLKNLEENLKSHGRKIQEIPLVFQYNKRDLSKILTVSEMNRFLNPKGHPSFEAVAIHGDGVLATLTRITRMVAEKIQGPEESARTSIKPSPIPDAPIIPIAESQNEASPKVIPSPSDFSPSYATKPGRAETAPLAAAKDAPRMSKKGFDALLGPEGDTTPLSEIGPTFTRDTDVATVMGEDVPSIGDLNAPPDFLSEPLHEEEEELSASPESPARSPAGLQAQPIVPDASLSFGIDPSLREIHHPGTEPGSLGKKPDITLGNPEKVGKSSFQIPVSITFPGSKQTFSFALNIDLLSIPDKKK